MGGGETKAVRRIARGQGQQEDGQENSLPRCYMPARNAPTSTYKTAHDVDDEFSKLTGPIDKKEL